MAKGQGRRRTQVVVGDEIFERRCARPGGTARAHATMALRDGVVSGAWAPAGGYVEVRTASVWARPLKDGDVEVLTCRWLPGLGGPSGELRWRLASGRVPQAALEGRGGVLRCPANLPLRAREWTLGEREADPAHPAVAYAREVDAAATRVLEELHALNVPASTCWSGWVSRRLGTESAFDFHFMLNDERTEARRKHALDGLAAAAERGKLVTDVKACPGCQDPSGGEVFASARRALGLDAVPPRLASAVSDAA